MHTIVYLFNRTSIIRSALSPLMKYALETSLVYLTTILLALLLISSSTSPCILNFKQKGSWLFLSGTVILAKVGDYGTPLLVLFQRLYFL